MFGGDEISAIVLDVGTNNTRAGYAGDDSPKTVFPSNVGVLTNEEGKYLVGTNSLLHRREFMEIQNPIEKGLVTNWDMLEQLWDYALKNRLRIDPKEHPILLTEPSFNTRTIREKMTELMFEHYQVPALFIAKNGVLTTFAAGKSSGLVLDSGGGVTCVTPVHDGYALQKALVKNSLAGNLLTNEYLKSIEKKGITIKPHYLIKSKKEIGVGQFEVELHDLPNITESFKNFQVLQVVKDIKETVSRVFDTAIEEAPTNIPAVGYELPDGHTIECGPERFTIPELLFNPKPLNERKEYDEEFIGIPEMIFNSVAKCDPDIRRELFSSIILTGGNTMLNQFPERLHKDLVEKPAPQMYKVKIMATNVAAERKFSSWIGGSILASLGTFHQMWMSKQEYDEHGRSMVERKCP